MDWIQLGLWLVIAGTTTVWVLQWLMGKARVTTLLLRLILIVGALAVMIVVLEYTTRLVFRSVTSTADNRAYFARQGPAAHVNSLGFREREFARVKPSDLYRIAVIGDSITYGQGLEEPERFTNLLQQYLKRGRNEVLNFGLPAHDLAEHLVVLEDSVLKVNPDFVLLQLFINDFETGHMQRPRTLPLLPFRDLDRRLYRSSALYSLAAIQWTTMQGWFRLFEPYPDYMRRSLAEPGSPDARESTKLLRTFIRRCKDSRLPVGMVFFPHTAFEYRRGYQFDYLHERVARICAEEAIPCVDLRQAFQRHRPLRRLWVNRFDSHPNAEANRAAAAVILTKFEPIWLAAGSDHVAAHVQ